MSDMPNLQIIWEEIQTQLLYLQRPAVFLQLLGIMLTTFVAAGVSKFGWLLVKRNYFPWLNRQPDEKTKKYGQAVAAIIENVGFPLLILIALPLTINLFETQGLLATLISQTALFFWVLLAYRLIISFLQIWQGKERLLPYQRRLLAPAFWLVMAFWLLSILINLPILARVELVTLFREAPLTIGNLFWIGVALYMLFAGAWAIQDIVVRVVAPRTTAEPGAINAALTIGRYIVLVLAVLIVFREVGLDPTSLAVIGGGLSVGIGIGLQSIFSNFVSGIILLFEQSLRQGDVVEVSGIMGTVERLGVRSTTVRTYDNVEMIIPNETFFTNAVTTYTHSSRITRVMLTIGVSYNSNPKEVMDILLSTAKEHGLVLADPAPDVFFEAYNNSSIDFHLAIWLGSPDHRKRVPSDLRLMIWKKFEKHGIEIPFPQQDIHIRSGVPWEKLSAVPQASDSGS
ncbi:MAG TPA: mechanosensitive ion channel [Anaerolineae bacterium]|nr:mechanosensitive ion channel [Anaerolineae bacterium]